MTDEYGQPITLLYFLGCLDVSRDSTLLLAQIPDTPLACRQIRLNSAFPNSTPGANAPMSREEQLLRERKRVCSYGLSTFELSQDGRFVIPANNSIYTCRTSKGDTIPEPPSEVPTLLDGARIDCKLCPLNSDLMAFVHKSDLWLTCLTSGKETRLTFAHNDYPNMEDNYLSAGVPSFVMQEEFDRYTGYWWSPNCQRLSDNQHIYHILYEEVDESEVEIFSICSSPEVGQITTDQYRYPRAGSTNAVSSLRLVQINVLTKGTHTRWKDGETVQERGTEIQVQNKSLRCHLLSVYPWGEYLVRAGWTQDANYIYAVIMDRLQQRLAVLLISLSSFSPEEAEERPTPPHIQCVYQETSDVWINVHNCIHFFPQTSESEISFLFASEKSGFRHLYLVTAKIDPLAMWKLQGGHGDNAEMFGPQIVCEVPVTSGNWAVLPDEICVDEQNQFVYFMGLKDSPLESHLYAVRYSLDGSTYPVQRLTQPNFSHTVTLSPDFRMFVSVFSSLQCPPQSAVYSLHHHGDGQVTCASLGHLTQRTDTTGYTPPNLFQFPSQAGHMTYGLYFLPRGYERGQRYPTILFVYGGPQVQMVTNSFKGQKLLRLHTLAAEGYAVVVIDGRGSSNRGLAFESVLKNSMGTVEIGDQVEGLTWLASQTGLIDLTRVAIHGWSYGGYLSLLGLAQRGDVFKVAIAGAPVVNWELYDTGYTERYLGLPHANPDVYRQANVTSYIHKLSEDGDGLLLVHGEIDENVHNLHTSRLVQSLIQHSKPYQLQVYPNERHGIRNQEASEHYKTTMLKFLQDNL